MFFSCLQTQLKVNSGFWWQKVTWAVCKEGQSQYSKVFLTTRHTLWKLPLMEMKQKPISAVPGTSKHFSISLPQK